MVLTMAKLAAMPNIEEYVTVEQATEHKGVPYTPHWLRILCQENKIEAIKVGKGARGQWLIHLPSLLEYIDRMEDLGTKKHSH